jgi:hypothetical protein
VDSPTQAAALLAGNSLRGNGTGLLDSGDPVSQRLARRVDGLRHVLDRDTGPPSWRWLAPEARLRLEPIELLRLGRTEMLLHVGVRDVLGRTLVDGIRQPVARRLGSVREHGFRWYGQHDGYWLARYDVQERLGYRRFTTAQREQLALWAATVRSCGWWWPRPDVCVVTERMSTVDTEPVPGAVHGELRLHNGSGMAVRYRDGTGLYSWHGTRVPAWVIEHPTVELIHTERNAEVRRCAIERLGWPAYLDQAALALLADAPDPGNPQGRLELYQLPALDPAMGAADRVLLVVNGSVERDGTRRRYGLRVPGNIDDPVGAAGWTYGLTGEQYRMLLRRT